MKRVILISCYFGKFPWYFQLFLHTCKHNPTIDFLIVTDQSTDNHGLPDNVCMVNTTLDNLNKEFSGKLQLKTNIQEAYKLCDFKPAFGFLFPAHLKDYDFWGHCDIDIIWGNIRAFISDELLNNYDVISARHDYVTGSFCLWRNNRYINTLFKQSRDYKMVFSDALHYCFDECAFLFSELQNGASVFDFPDHLQSMTYIVQDFARQGKLKAHFDFLILEGIPGNIRWENGKVFYKDEFEALYYHLIKFKCQVQHYTLHSFPIHNILFSPNDITVNS